MSYLPYPNLNESGVPWIGLKPRHWQVMKLQQIVRMRSGSAITSIEMDETSEYPVYGGNGHRGYFSAYTHEGAYVLIGRQGAECGNINYADGKFWASEHAVVASPDRDLSHRWLGETLRAMDLNQYSQSAAQPGLSVEVIGRLKLPFPPLDEQHQIAAFLDWKTSQIDALIAKKQALLQKLKEKRLAVITQAVTKGLNPDAPMRDSGIAWLGEVPAHWSVIRFGYKTTIEEGQVDPEFEPYSSMLLIAPNHIESNTGKIHDITSASDQGAISGKYLVHKGDIVYSKIRPQLNKCALADFDGLCSADMYPIRTEPDLSPLFLLYWMLAQPFHDYATESSMRVAMPKLNRDTLNAAPLVAPPIGEQAEITKHLDGVTCKVDEMTTKTQSAITRLTEYRAALITAATTGKIDVRDWSPTEEIAT